MRVITRHRSITLKHVCFDLKFIKSYKSLQYNGLKNLFSPVVAFQMYHLSISLATMEKGNSHSWQAVNRSSSNLLHAGWYKSTSTGTVQCFTGSNASLVPLTIIEKKYITSSVYDCTVEDVEYIYNTLSLLVTLIRHLVVVITLP